MSGSQHSAPSRRRRRLASAMGWLAIVLISLPAVAQNRWEQNKGECATILSDPQFYELEQVRECAQRWEAYGDASFISRTEAETYARGFSRLYHQGERRDQSLAESALSRLGLSVLPAGGSFMPNEELEAFLARNQSPIRVHEAGSRESRRAREHNTRGMREYERGNFESAAEEFEEALQDDPFYLLAKYNLACQRALLGDTDEAIGHLDDLNRWDSGDSDDQLSHALTDGDLESLRDDVRFRLIVGSARVQVLNGAGDGGVARATAIRDALVEQGHQVPSLGHDRFSRARPLVYYNRGFEELAEEVVGIVGQEGTRSRRIDWSSEYDLIVVWGTAAGPAALSRPVVQGLLRVDGGDPEESMEDAQEVLEEVPDVVEDPAGAAEEWQPDF